MSVEKEDILLKLAFKKPILNSKYNVTELALFGSYSRDEQNEKSGVDIMVVFDKITYRNLCNTAYTLHDIFPNTKVQVVSKDAIKPAYFNAIKNDLVYA
jgi:predicted nucleotidyltransferase